MKVVACPRNVACSVGGLFSIGESKDSIVQLYIKLGDFGVTGQPLTQVQSKEPVGAQIEAAIQSVSSWRIERPPEQDVMYSLETGKAMSAAINGQFTAVLRLNQHERALAEFLTRHNPDGRYIDSEGVVRIALKPIAPEVFLSKTGF